MLTDKELAEIKLRCDKAASLEEWANTDSTGNIPFYIHLKRPRPSISHDEGEGTKRQKQLREYSLYNWNDGIFILNAKSDILKLIEEIEYLKSLLPENKSGAV